MLVAAQSNTGPAPADAANESGAVQIGPSPRPIKPGNQPPTTPAEPGPRPVRPGDQPPAVTGESIYKIETRIVGISQRVNGGGSPDGDAHTRTNFRADVFLTVDAGRFGNAKGVASGQLRAGSGRSVGVVPTYSTVNSTSFDPEDGRSRNYGFLAQAFYELKWPVGARSGSGAVSVPAASVLLTAGKLDVFGFFDQNRVASNENVQFVNNVFVHNPLLDAGSDIVAGKYGYQPGVRAGYFADQGSFQWGASVGVFASGPSADFSQAPKKPFVIAQLNLSPRQSTGRPRDNYRLYAWTNGRTEDVAGNEQRNTGIGLSADQRVGRDFNLFQRLGHRASGNGRFNNAITLGGELEGRPWGRSRDGVGVAFGWLKTSNAYQAFTADGTQAGYAAGGAEKIVELYYRCRVNDWLQISPDFQWIRRPAGHGGTPVVAVFGLRARVAF